MKSTFHPSTQYRSTQQLFMVYHPECGAVNFHDIQSDDTLLINTESNLYSFRVTNDKVLRGRLSKGNNDESADAILVGSLVCEPRRLRTLRSELKIQAHAVFLILDHNQFIELATPPIVGLSLLMTRQSESFERIHPMTISAESSPATELPG
jgi:hypothetical protein